MTHDAVWRFHRDKWGSDTAERRCQNWGKATPGLNPDSHVLGTVARQVKLRVFFFWVLPCGCGSFKVCLVFVVKKKRKQKVTHKHTEALGASCHCDFIWSHPAAGHSSTLLIKRAVNTHRHIYHPSSRWNWINKKIKNVNEHKLHNAEWKKPAHWSFGECLLYIKSSNIQNKKQMSSI